MDTLTSTTHAAPSTRRPLADLVRVRHDEGQASYRDMADRARKAGHELSHSQAQAYATDNVRKPPSRAQLAALAAALDVPYPRVLAAMFEQYYEYTPPTPIPTTTGERVLAAVPDDLTNTETHELIRLVTAWSATRQPIPVQSAAAVAEGSSDGAN